MAPMPKNCFLGTANISFVTMPFCLRKWSSVKYTATYLQLSQISVFNCMVHFSGNDFCSASAGSPTHPNVCIWAKPNTKLPIGTSAISAAWEPCELSDTQKKAACPVNSMLHSLL